MLTALLSRGHILLEGVPGTAKTFLAQVFAHVTKLDFGRIQFTPDLLPGDLLGTNLFSFQTNKFTLVKGPIFCDMLLADEINRTPPKTQSALLEARDAIAGIHLNDEVTHYVVDLVRGTRDNPLFETGASPRAAAMIASSARAFAALQSRNYVIPDDVKSIALPALRHRAVLSPAAEIEGRTADEVITAVIEQTQAPR